MSCGVDVQLILSMTMYRRVHRTARVTARPLWVIGHDGLAFVTLEGVNFMLIIVVFDRHTHTLTHALWCTHTRTFNFRLSCCRHVSPPGSLRLQRAFSVYINIQLPLAVEEMMSAQLNTLIDTRIHTHTHRESYAWTGIYQHSDTQLMTGIFCPSTC